MQLVQVPERLQPKERNAARQLALVVDDQPSIQEMLSWVLCFQGYQSVCVANGQEALTWLEKAADRREYPSVILLDLLMPVMNGQMFLERLRTRWNAPIPVPPVILLTVDSKNHDQLPCSNVLIKPFHIHELSQCLKMATGKASQMRTDQ